MNHPFGSRHPGLAATPLLDASNPALQRSPLAASDPKARALGRARLTDPRVPLPGLSLAERSSVASRASRGRAVPSSRDRDRDRRSATADVEGVAGVQLDGVEAGDDDEGGDERSEPAAADGGTLAKAPAARAAQTFIPAASFCGAKPGFVFKLGTAGLGYYGHYGHGIADGDEERSGQDTPDAGAEQGCIGQGGASAGTAGRLSARGAAGFMPRYSAELRGQAGTTWRERDAQREARFQHEDDAHLRTASRRALMRSRSSHEASVLGLGCM